MSGAGRGARETLAVVAVLAVLLLSTLLAASVGSGSSASPPSAGAPTGGLPPSGASVGARTLSEARASLARLPPPTAGPMAANGGWEQPTPTQDGAAIAYDPLLGGVVLYGDCDAVQNYSTLTWFFSNASWSLLPTPNGTPPGLCEPGLVYDPALDGVLLFGGARVSGATQTPLNETWLFSGSNWTRLFPAHAPPAREAPQLVYDTAQQEVVLFAGMHFTASGYVPLNDTWTFANGTWSPSAPGPSSTGVYWAGPNEGFAYDPTLNASVLVTSNRTWLLTNGSWSLAHPGAMPQDHAQGDLIFDPATGALLLFGGCCNRSGDPFNDTWAFGSGNWTQLLASGTPLPTGYYDPATAYDPAVAGVVLYAGDGLIAAAPAPDASTWLFANDSWSAVNTSTNAYQRFGGAFVYDPAEGGDLLFGGWTTGGVHRDSYNAGDTWLYRNGTWTLLSETTAPTGRAVASIAYDPANQSVILFGGSNYGSGNLGDTWSFANGTWTHLTPSTSPSGRSGAAMVYDAADHYLLLFGGEENQGFRLGDTWTFANGTWTNITASVSGAPRARAGAAMVYDAQMGRVVMFGGGDSTGLLSDTWTYHAGVWKNITSSAGSAPPPRDSPAFVYDPTTETAVMTGGGNWFSGANHNYGSGAQYEGTWNFSNGSWVVEHLLFSPLPQANPEATYDATLGQVVVYGGDDSPSAMWYWTGPAALADASLSATPSTLEVGQASVLVATARGGQGSYRYAWQGLPPGCASGNAPTNDCSPDQTGNYTVSVNVSDGAHQWVIAGPVNLTVVAGPANASLAAAPTVLDVGQALVLNASATGGEHPYHYTWTGLPAGCSSSDSANLSCDPSGAGHAWINVTITDALGGSVRAGPAQVTVNAALTIGVAVRPAAIDLGQNLSLAAQVTGGTSPFTYFWTGLPGGCSADTAAIVNCTPTAVGGSNVTVWVRDATGANVSYGPVPLSVNPDLTIGFTISRAAIDLGQSVYLNATASGGTGPLGYSWAGLPDGCPDRNASSLRCTPTVVGPSNVTLWVHDAAGSNVSYGPLPLTVAPALDVEGLAIAPSSVDLGTPVDLTTTVTGGLGPWTFTYSGLPAGCASTDAASFDCAPTDAGTFTVEVVVADATGAAGSASAVLMVAPVLALGTLGATPGTIDVGQSSVLTAPATGGTPPLSWSYTDLPNGCATTDGPSLSCAPTTEGSYTIVVTVTDAAGASVQGTIDLVVDPALVVRGIDVSPAPVTVGAPVTLTVNASGGASPLAVTWAGLWAGCGPGDTRAVTCTTSVPGTFRVAANVTDALGETGAASASVTVNPPSLTITAFTASPMPVTVGATLTLSVTASGGWGPLTIGYGSLPLGCPSQNTSQLTCRPTAAGNFTVYVTVRDGVGQSITATTNVTVVEASPSHGGGGGTTSSGTGSMSVYLWVGVAAAAVIVPSVLCGWCVGAGGRRRPERSRRGSRCLTSRRPRRSPPRTPRPDAASILLREGVSDSRKSRR
jgi:hypothetical protein